MRRWTKIATQQTTKAQAYQKLIMMKEDAEG
jgi:hypothetical protein